jgi:hypothetical protein
MYTINKMSVRMPTAALIAKTIPRSANVTTIAAEPERSNGRRPTFEEA